jgi:hypothetical protein
LTVNMMNSDCHWYGCELVRKALGEKVKLGVLSFKFVLHVLNYRSIIHRQAVVVWDWHRNSSFCLLLPASFLLVACLALYSTLKMEAVLSRERPINLYQNTRRYIPEDSKLQHIYDSERRRHLYLVKI